MLDVARLDVMGEAWLLFDITKTELFAAVVFSVELLLVM